MSKRFILVRKIAVWNCVVFENMILPVKFSAHLEPTNTMMLMELVTQKQI